MPEPTWSAITAGEVEVEEPFTGSETTPDGTSLAERLRIRDCALKAQPLDLRLPVGSTGSTSFTTIGTIAFYVPNYKVGLNVRGLYRRQGGGTSAQVRAIINGTTDDVSDEDSTTSTSFVAFDVTITEIANNKGQLVTFELQVKQTGGGTAEAKIEGLDCRFIAIEE